MELLQDIAAIAGKPGLYKIIKPGRAGVVVETLDALKKKEMVNANARVSVLKEISVYTDEHNGSKPLGEIFRDMKAICNEKASIDLKTASGSELFKFFGEVMPNFDKEKVYANDIKKIISWYNALVEFVPEIFEGKIES
ncbi:MAG: DUF5606 family protein [Leadbetterella sp.]